MQILKNKRGMALLLTITITTILVAATLELNREVRATVMATATTRDRFTLSHIAESGIQVGMIILAKDRKSSATDSIQEDWADPDKISEVLQDIVFEKGSLALKISDELGKIQVNALVDKFPGGHNFNEAQLNIWDNIVRPIVSKDEKSDLNATTNIINSIKDWMDSEDDDAITGMNGAESDYYESLDPPYSCRNGPIPSAKELLMIKGVTPEMLYGSGETGGISDYITVYGMTQLPQPKNTRKNNAFTYEGKININTAEVPVLIAILGEENAECARTMDDYRRESEDTGDGKHYLNDVTNPAWYKNVKGCSDLNIDPRLITVTSDFFRIESTATLNEVKLTLSAVIHREQDKKTGKWKCRVLSWETL